MPVDAFIWFKAPDSASTLSPVGETTDSVFSKDGPDKLGSFELRSFSFSVENKATLGSATSGGGGGKIQFNEFEITKPTDAASPLFFRNCAAGMHYEVVSIAIRKAGGSAGAASGAATTGKPYLVFHFGTVFTTKIGINGPGDEGPEESITFAYGELKIMYYPQKADGTMAKTSISEWSQVKNLNKFFGKPKAFGT